MTDNHIQRLSDRQWRVKGGRKPAGCIYVGRNSHGALPVGTPGYWANPYKVIPYGPYTLEEAIAFYRHDVEAMSEADRSVWLEPLRGATALACACKPGEPCHADVLIEVLQKERNGT